MTTFPVTERITRVTPLGLRFLDEGAGVPVPDGLVITVTPPAGPAVAAQLTPGGTWIAHDITGLRDVEQGLGTIGWWLGETTALPCHVSVVDALGRFLPTSMDLDLPIRGAVVDPCVPALGTTLGIPLFSGPGRAAPPGRAAVRAQLVDASTHGPASNAVLEVRHDGDLLGRGVADDAGRVAAFVTWPKLAAATPDVLNALAGQTWELDLAARYHSLPPAPAGAPDLCAVLDQPAATLLDTISPPHPLPAASLVFGHELVVRSAGQSTVYVLPPVP